LLVAQDHAVAVGNAGDDPAGAVAKAVSDRIVRIALGLAAPLVAMLVAKADEIALAMTIEDRLAAGILKLKVAAWRGCQPSAASAVYHHCIMR